MRSNIEIYSEKFNLILACTRKRSLSCRCQISPPVHHSSHPKCFQIMNIQIVEFDLRRELSNTELIVYLCNDTGNVLTILWPCV